MGLKVKFDQRALTDLTDIRDYLLERDPTGADHVRSQIVSTIDRLGEHPNIGRPTDAPNIRVVPLTRYPYLIFYTILENSIAILHIRHTARKPVDPTKL